MEELVKELTDRMNSTYDYELEIALPGETHPERGYRGDLVRSAEGSVTVTQETTEEQIRAHLVTELAKDHAGKTVTVRHFSLRRKP